MSRVSLGGGSPRGWRWGTLYVGLFFRWRLLELRRLAEKVQGGEPRDRKVPGAGKHQKLANLEMAAAACAGSHNGEIGVGNP